MSAEIETARDVEICARVCMEILVRLGIEDAIGYKSYDPMTIDESSLTAHSYVFDLEDGGRHHKYKTLEQLKEQILTNTVLDIKSAAEFGFD